MDTNDKRLITADTPRLGGELYPARLTRTFRRMCLIAGVLSVLLGAVVLAGWVLGSERLQSLVRGAGVMKSNTALGFLGSGAAILLLALGRSRLTRGWAAVGAAVPLAGGVATLAQYLFGWEFGIDQLLFRDTVQTAYPGRMAPNTAACLAIVGMALLFAAGGRWRMSMGLAVVPMTMGFLAMLGYLFGAILLYRISTYVGMALNTALGFVVVSFGIRMLRPARLVVASSSAGGILVRRLIPEAILALVALGWVRLLGQRAGLYGTEMGVAIMTAGAIFIVTVLIQMTARSLHGVDLERLEAGRALRALNAELEDRVRERTAELAASEDRFRSFAEASFEAIVVHEDGVVVEVNEVVTELFGYERDELIGHLGVEKLVAPEFRGLAREVIRTGREGRWDVEAVRKDGTRFWASGSIRNVVYGGRSVRVTALRDISARKQVEAALRTALEQEHEAGRLLALARDEALEISRLKSDFLANMSHEIRTPMNAVIGMTGLLLDTPLTSEQREFASAVRGAGEALLEIINEILDFSKIEAGKLRIEPTEFELRLVVEEVVDLLALRAHEKGLELAAVVDPGVPAIVHGDSGRLRQILTNLTGNAVKFTDRGEVVIRVRAGDGLHPLRDPDPSRSSRSAGRLEVRLDPPPGEGGSEGRPDQYVDQEGAVVVRFEVTDSGPGITEADQRTLFQSFHQLDTSPARRFGGTGLGLAISKQLVELMGGAIGVRSELGAGSTFWFTLPMGSGRAQVHLARRSPEVARARVLVVDDNASVPALLVDQLGSWRIHAEGVAGDVAALAALRDAAKKGESFDVALVNGRGTSAEGPTLAAAISADPQIAPARVVVLTSSSRRTECLAGNVAGHLTKPLRESQLLACLERVVKGISLEPERRSPDAPLAAGYGPDVLVPPRKFAGRLLVAEDNSVNQMVAVRMLERLGYRADVVSNGAEALEAMSRIDYAVVLMDCQMPELDGFGATREIRRREAGDRHTPVIAMTADAMQGDRDRCVEAGMDDYVSKPVRPEQLAAVLRRWVATSDVTV